MLRFLAAALLFGAAMYGGDINIPLEGGSILIKDAHFIRVEKVSGYKFFPPELSFTALNGTTAHWDLKLRFDMAGRCKNKAHQWSTQVSLSMQPGESKSYKDTVVAYIAEVKGCETENIQASLILAENKKLRIDGLTGERVDLEKKLQELNVKRDAEETAQAKVDGIIKPKY